MDKTQRFFYRDRTHLPIHPIFGNHLNNCLEQVTCLHELEIRMINLYDNGKTAYLIFLCQHAYRERASFALQVWASGLRNPELTVSNETQGIFTSSSSRRMRKNQQ